MPDHRWEARVWRDREGREELCGVLRSDDRDAAAAWAEGEALRLGGRVELVDLHDFGAARDDAEGKARIADARRRLRGLL